MRIICSFAHQPIYNAIFSYLIRYIFVYLQQKLSNRQTQFA
nr:MAG TPA: hypothetical protein [Caudoviricetes sp.]